MENAQSQDTPIMRAACRLPELIRRSDSLQSLSFRHPEGSSRRNDLTKQSRAAFDRACSIEGKIATEQPRNLDDLVVLLKTAADFAESAEYACLGDDKENEVADLSKVRAALRCALAFAAELTDFDMSLIDPDL